MIFPAVTDKRVLLEEFPNRSSGIMQAFALNIRRDQVQRSSGASRPELAFDFEEMNKQMFFGQYKRINSYFDGTELASCGLPQGKELEILETVRAEVPAEVFTTAYTNPVGGNPEAVRENLREALRLLKEAGYEVRDRKLIDSKTGTQFAFELLSQDPCSERVMLFLQAFPGAARHRGQRTHHRSDANTRTGFANGISTVVVACWGSRYRRATSSANTGARRRPTWRARETSSASRIRPSTS